MGTLSLVAPLVLFEKSRLWAGTGFHLLPSFHHHPTQHNYTTQTVTHITDTHPTCNVVCPSGAWLENKPHSTPSIRLGRNPKHVIVQWVGIGTHTHTLLKIIICIKLEMCFSIQIAYTVRMGETIYRKYILGSPQKNYYYILRTIRIRNHIKFHFIYW